MHCPQCGSDNTRPSRWNSRGEKARNPEVQPMRCLDCNHRFLTPLTAERKTQIVAALAVAGALGIFMVVVLSLLLDHRPVPVAEVPAKDVSITISAEAMKAAEDGSPEAQFAVATSLLADSELSQAYSTKALNLLERAANQGHERAMLRLGLLYRKGIGALQNYSLAAKWIGAAASRGDPEAMREMGRLYREGIGVEQDPVRAYQWLNRAAAAHDTDAVRERADVARLLTAEELQQAQNEITADPQAAQQQQSAELKSDAELSLSPR